MFSATYIRSAKAEVDPRDGGRFCAPNFVIGVMTTKFIVSRPDSRPAQRPQRR
jgi:hypothetical protein